MARVRTVLLTLALVAAVAACGDDGGDDDVTATSVTTSTTPTEPGTTTSTSSPAPATTAGGPTTAPDIGTPIDIFPYEGDELAVVGVASDDTLNVRSGPTADHEIVAELEPLATGIVAAGRNVQIPGGAIWAQVGTGGTSGWANTAYLAQLGRVDDITSELDGSLSAPSLNELAGKIATARGPEEGRGPTVTVVAGPAEGDLAEVTVDAIGYQDDALKGERLHVFARKDGDRYGLKSVEATMLCVRGVEDGLCM